MARVTLKGDKEIVKFLRKTKREMARIHTDTVNDVARHTSLSAKMSGGTIDRQFTLRNGFTKRSVGWKRAVPGPRAISKAGAFNFGEGDVRGGDYLRAQETGENNWHVGHIPTLDARIQKSAAKRVTSRQRLKAQNFPQTGTIIGRRQAFVAIQKMKRGRTRTPMKIKMPTKRGNQTGMYRLTRSNKLRMIHNISENKVKLRPRRWLVPAAKAGMIVGERKLKQKLKKLARKF